MFTNLNLNGNAPARVQPKLGEWGPQRVPSTAAKKRMRIWVSLAFVVALTVIIWVGYTFFKAFTQGQ